MQVNVILHKTNEALFAVLKQEQSSCIEIKPIDANGRSGILTEKHLNFLSMNAISIIRDMRKKPFYDIMTD